MADKIKLPPMMSHPECHTYVWTDDEKAAIRARDLEVARAVLEAAAQAAGPDDSYQDLWFAAKANAVKRIRALEVSHE